MSTGSLDIVGLGPGALDLLTPEARAAIEAADVLLGYGTYLDLIAALAPGTPREATGMRHEVQRVARAIALASAGRRVALVSGGDPGIYGMAGLALEMLAGRGQTLPVRIIPGVSALNAAAALLGAPLMTDFAAISLSDQLVPLAAIVARLEAVAAADLVIALYNPKGMRRAEPWLRACEILLQQRRPATPVGIVRAAFREGQRVTLTTLEHLAEAEVDMVSTVIVGNSRTYVADNRLITPRGYDAKYDLSGLPEGHQGAD